ncbi:MAG: alpha/beta fold hydrolase [Planctomycetota bacterium]
MNQFKPPNYIPARFAIAQLLSDGRLSGHLHTLLPANGSSAAASCVADASRHLVPLPDGDALVLFENKPRAPGDRADRVGDAAVLLIHGLCGCHAAGYMMRFAAGLLRHGITTYRLDMRGCGAAQTTCQNITHAGRSDDVLAAMSFIATRNPPTTSLGMVGVSLGGNQVLRACGRVASGLNPEPIWWPRVDGVLAIAPPIDLKACSDAMQSRWLRFYNWYFIRQLLRRVPPAVANNKTFQSGLSRGIPKTLRTFDRFITAPLAGYSDERAYYADASAMHHLSAIDRPTMIVTADDDPLIPTSMFESRFEQFSPSTTWLRQPRGGHNGFLQAGRRAWTDDLVTAFFVQRFSHASVE